MAPINLPDGSQVSEIVLPDGSTASEVVAPDGSTVFSAIPDYWVAHWPHDEGSESTIADAIGDVDATLGSNATWQSGTGRGGFYVEYGTTASASDLGSAGNTLISDNWVANNEGAFGCWLKPANNDFHLIFGTITSSGGTEILCLLRDNTEVQWSFTVNGSETDLRTSVYRTNEWQAVVFTCDGSDMYIYHTDSNDSVSQVSSGAAPGTDSDGSLGQNPTIGDGVGGSTLEQDDAWFSDEYVTVSEAQDWVDDTKDNY